METSNRCGFGEHGSANRQQPGSNNRYGWSGDDACQRCTWIVPARPHSLPASHPRSGAGWGVGG